MRLPFDFRQGAGHRRGGTDPLPASHAGSLARYFAAHLLKRSVKRSMFSSQKPTLISTAFLMLSGAVGRSFRTAGWIRAAASLFEVP